MTVKTARAPSDEAQPRAWHIDKSDGLGEIVVAHRCTIDTPTGIVSFHNVTPSGDLVLVRALHVAEWGDVVLVDTPFGPQIQLDAPTIGRRS